MYIWKIFFIIQRRCQHNTEKYHIVTLAHLAVSIMHRSDVRPSVRPIFLTLIGHAADNQHDSTGAAGDAASVHFCPSITRTDILVNALNNWTAMLWFPIPWTFA